MILENNVEFHDLTRAGGNLKLEKANVNWHLSIDEKDLPVEAVENGKRTFRSITIDGESFEFSEGFTDLHTICYQKYSRRQRLRSRDSKKAIELVSQIRKK